MQDTEQDIEQDTGYEPLANAVEELINMDNIKDGVDLERRLEKCSLFRKNRIGGPTRLQVNALADYYNVSLYNTYDVGGVSYISFRDVLSIKSHPEPKEYDVVIHQPVGFRKKQIRDVRTGKVLKWID